jgi:hypothetical protein
MFFKNGEMQCADADDVIGASSSRMRKKGGGASALAAFSRSRAGESLTFSRASDSLVNVRIIAIASSSACKKRRLTMSDSVISRRDGVEGAQTECDAIGAGDRIDFVATTRETLSVCVVFIGIVFSYHPRVRRNT